MTGDLATAGPVEAVEGAGASAGMSRRRAWVAAVAVGAVLLSGAGVAASLVIKSPAQTAAEAGPPPLDVLVAQVEKRVLRDTVIVRGTVTSAQSLQVTPAVAGGEGAATPVVTKVAVRQGDRVDAGKVLLEVSGRPVFALPGGLPVYRDLKPGATGDDVKQVQKALSGLGHGTGSDRAGRFGAGTKAALGSFYRSIGYDPLPAVADRGEAVRAAEDAVTSGERSLEDARSAATAVGTAAPAGPGAAPPGQGGKGAGGAKGSGQDAARAVNRASEDLRRARERLAEARAAAGPMLPAGEVVFLESFPARADSVAVRPGSPVSGAALSLSAGALVVRGQLQEHQKGLVRAGQKVEILSEVSGLTAAAEVLSVADAPQTAQPAAPNAGSGGGDQGQGRQAPAPGGPAGYEMLVRPLTLLDTQLVGQDVRLTVEAAATDGDALVVPVSAVSAGADGRTTVTVVDGTGTQRRVEVRPGTTGDGYVEIRPTGDGTLAAGDSVVTGVNPGAAGKQNGGKQNSGKGGGS
ncbi:peptidoglycan-binding protein [Streptomyces antarcticus]|uniref:peptidoglycan-binding protein n=1 Tax=Streptomyces antarcticus TaxID=2996458 RepID=UPI00226F9DBA|nr:MULTISPECIES: peptidoglycan-binding protein [unclassified Streptomyces]MCY0947541.1 peptidoglycan-binding protein [Streptomyces sp. H34-AA3]MCZ4087180.1 peptidoglycan-binding protein [Streptomyces sp. H34-S5]